MKSATFAFLITICGFASTAQAQPAVEESDDPQVEQPTPAARPSIEGPGVSPRRFHRPDPPCMSTGVCADEQKVGIHLGVNLALFAFDVQVGHFYAMVAGNAAVPLLSNGDYGAFTLLGGYSTAIHRGYTGSWKMDILLQASPGWRNFYPQDNSRVVSAFVGVGAVLGFRYEHRSGFSLGFKIPVFGYSIGRNGPAGTITGVGNYYLASIVSLPVVSLGYRF